MRSSKNLLLALFAFTTLATGIFAWRQHLELVSLRAAAPVREQVAATRAASPVALEPSATAPEPIAQDVFASPAASDGIDATNPPPNSNATGPRFTRRDAVIETPEVQRLMMIQRKAGLDGRYAALFKSLNLRPDQLERFKELLVERMTVRNDVMGAVRSQGANPRADRDAITALVRDGEAEIDDAIRGLIGEASYSQYQHYERTQPVRATVNHLEQRLSYSSTPLSPEQSSAILSILDRNGGTTTPSIGRVGVVTDAAIEQARGVLAAPQLEALRQLQQEQRAQAEIAETMRRQFESRRPNAP